MASVSNNMVFQRLLATLALGVCCAGLSHAQLGTGVGAPAEGSGPWNGTFIQDGLGLSKPSAAGQWNADSKWSLYGWTDLQSGSTRTVIVQLGSSGPALVVADGKLAIWTPEKQTVLGGGRFSAGVWHFVAATYDSGTLHLYLDNQQVGATKSRLDASSSRLELAPSNQLMPGAEHFSGRIAGLTLAPGVLDSSQIQQLAGDKPNPDLIIFEAGSKDWPMQTRQQVGYRAPQPPSTLPHSATPPQAPVAKPATNTEPKLEQRGDNLWAITGAWKLIAGPEIHEGGDQISTSAYTPSGWLDAVVPGTVLTTYIDRGVYPDSDYGLNNLAIPEKLSRQDYWYRTTFPTPTTFGKGDHLSITFNGINYAAEVWLNGTELGSMKGAFIRGIFDVSRLVEPGKTNVLAVRVLPPPHPGIPQEQSIKGGPGENGGMMVLDGPTFVATEGWDWIPAIRDRNTGIWQDVMLSVTGTAEIGDPQVITKLPLPRTDSADVEIRVPLAGTSDAVVDGDLTASFEGVEIHKHVRGVRGQTLVTLTPSEFPQLHINNPRLWWPNAYGNQDLYHLELTFSSGGKTSDTKTLRFGIREISYEVSALDANGKLRRVEYDPTLANGQTVMDTRHEGMIESAKGWVMSLVPGAENSPSLKPVQDTRMTPYLAIRVNGVRIAAKGGNWGMDDSRKRVSREHLEPFFRLHKEANLNIIRNWVGQDTEETFYDLADEYGLLVWNDFWDSTQNYNAEPTDAGLFLENARDVIARFRNHPSIVMWCGRNEGVPPVTINEGLDDAIRSLDGTRYYSPSSNTVNLQGSGPYKYQEPEDYFTKFARGFSVELGIPSLPTLDAFKAFVPPSERWPMTDTWAYHDWHFSGNGVIAPFLSAVEERFGTSSNLEEFEKKAQMLNYEDHRAIFEGFNAHLWNPNSARMLWMTQPAWPSTMWQILSSDYDTQASFYGVKKASEPVHVQMNLPDLTVAGLNNTRSGLSRVTAKAEVFSTDGKSVYVHAEPGTIDAGQEHEFFRIELPATVSETASFVELTLADSQGKQLSSNFYWYAKNPAKLRTLDDLPAAAIQVEAKPVTSGNVARVAVTLQNQSDGFALMNHLVLRDANGNRILPAYFTDNYVSLLPHEQRAIQIEAPVSAVHGPISVSVDGWNAKAVTAPVQ